MMKGDPLHIAQLIPTVALSNQNSPVPPTPQLFNSNLEKRQTALPNKKLYSIPSKLHDKEGTHSILRSLFPRKKETSRSHYPIKTPQSHPHLNIFPEKRPAKIPLPSEDVTTRRKSEREREIPGETRTVETCRLPGKLSSTHSSSPHPHSHPTHALSEHSNIDIPCGTGAPPQQKITPPTFSRKSSGRS